MTSKIIAALSAFIITVISSGGYLGIIALMAIDSACIPLPSEIIMPFSGYLVHTGPFQLLWVATVGALGRPGLRHRLRSRILRRTAPGRKIRFLSSYQPA